MCPVCLATMGLYVAGAASAGGITAYLTTKILRRLSDPHESAFECNGDDHDRTATDDRIER
jgi:hypothetical protein